MKIKRSRLGLAYFVVAFLACVAGLATGWITVHSMYLVILALIASGPMATIAIARNFSKGWFFFNTCYISGWLFAVLGPLFHGDTLGPNSGHFPWVFGVSSLLVGWLVGWLIHE